MVRSGAGAGAALLTGKNPEEACELAQFLAAGTSPRFEALADAGTVRLNGTSSQEIVGTRRASAGGGKETVRYTLDEEGFLRSAKVYGIGRDGKPMSRTEVYSELRHDEPIADVLFAAKAPVAAPASIGAPAGIALTKTASSSPEPLKLTVVGNEAKRVAASGSGKGAFRMGEVSVLDSTRSDAVFTLRNDTGAPVVLRSIRTTCGCTSSFFTVGGEGGAAPQAVPTGQPITLAPGKTADVRITLDLTRVAYGPVHKSVYVLGDRADQGEAAKTASSLSMTPVAELSIQGTLRPLVTFSPPVVAFGPVPAGESRSVRVTASIDARLFAPGGAGLPALASSHPSLVVREAASGEAPPASADRVVRTYEVSLAPDVPLGALSGHLSFGGGAGPGRVTELLRGVVVPFSANVSGDIAPEVQLLAFGMVAKGETRSLRMGLAERRAGAARGGGGLRAESDQPWLRAVTRPPAPAPLPNASAGSLEVTVGADAPAGLHETAVRVVLPDGKRLVIPISVYVR